MSLLFVLPYSPVNAAQEEIQNYVLIGCPGSGKGTLSQFLTQKGYVKIATGDLLRKEVKNKTKIGEKIKATLNKGGMVPDNIVCEMIRKHIKDCLNKQKPFVIDGFPQNKNQFEFLKSYLRQEGISQKTRFVFIKIDTNTALRRINKRITCKQCDRIYNKESRPPKLQNQCNICHEPLSHRKEDNERAIAVQVPTFEQKTLPIITMIDNNLLITFDGNKPIEVQLSFYATYFPSSP
ncbi:MAG: nucleoside monophosphate kinase [Bacteroidota bacterium]